MPITSLTCTSRQARTHRLHWMQASSCTAIAGWLRSGAGGARCGKRLSLDLEPVGPLPEARIRVVRRGPLGLVADQQFEHQLARGLGALAGGMHLHARASGWRMHEAASTRSPSISTMQARQLPSAR